VAHQAHQIWGHVHYAYLAVGLPSPNAAAPKLPGVGILMSFANDLDKFGLVFSFIGIVFSAIRLGIGHHSGNPGEVTKAKHGIMASLLAALLLGGAKALITTFSGLSTL
jgi:hypothetical protein